MAYQLQQAGLVDLLESDPRPTFVVAIDSATTTPTVPAIPPPADASTAAPSPAPTETTANERPTPPITFANPSLTSSPHLLDLLVSSREDSHDRFWTWVITPASASPTSNSIEDDDLRATSFWHLNLLWTKTIVRSLWVVVGANEQPSAERPLKMLQTATTPICEPITPPPLSPLIPVQRPESPAVTAAAAPVPSLEPTEILQPKPSPSFELLPTLTSYLDQDRRAFLDVVSSLDWATTPVGTLDAWPSRLRQLFYQIIADTRPTAIYWGEQRIVIYNHAFSRLCGSQHPGALGKPAPKTGLDTHGPPQSPIELFAQQHEWSTVQNEATIFVRDGTGDVLETHIESSVMPVLDAGECLGFLHSLQDITDSRLWERRMNMLFDFSDALLTANDVKSYWGTVMSGLEAHSSSYDIPLAALYSVEYRHATISDNNLIPISSTPKICRLEGSLGVPAGHALIPDTFYLSGSGPGLGPQFKQAFDGRGLVHLQTVDGSLLAELMDGIALRGFGDKCSAAVILPIQPTKKNDPLGLLLLGLNPRRPFDEGYKRYMSLLNKKLSAYLASAILLETSIADDVTSANGRASDSDDPIQTSPERTPQMTTTPGQLQLDLEKPFPHLPNGTVEGPLKHSELISIVPPSPLLPDSSSMHDSVGSKVYESEKLQRMTDLVTVGISETDLQGRLLDANKTFFELFGIVKVDDLYLNDIRPWDISMAEEGKVALQESLDRLVKDGMPQTVEMRLNTLCSTPGSLASQEKAPRWVLATFIPLRSADGIIHSIHGCFSDVSSQKWQVESERRRKEEALESKRQQENFMDMTSHEMRNPLGAITHCADAIASSLSMVQEKVRAAAAARVVLDGPVDSLSPQTEEHPELEDYSGEAARTIDECIDNAETIIACAQHQKRIIDDLLTVSKLDSKLVAVTPCTVDPVVMVRNTLKMFEVEAKRLQVDLRMTVDQSFVDLGFEYFDFDPSRAKQVLINLLTNALKFTRNRTVRDVSVLIKAGRSRPTDETSCVRFMPRSHDEPENPQPALVGRKDPVYLTFEVQDTGRGLSADEMRHLFNRFQQASSFTHVNHGGSGLGLFISRRLTELQNGAIGVSSTPKVGSTFVFFIEAYLPSEEAVKETALTTTPSDMGLVRLGRKLSAGEVGDCIPSKHTTDTGLDLAPARTEPHPSASAASKLDSILIVEDNVINQRIAQRGLVHRGFKVDVASDGLEALDKLGISRHGNESNGATGTSEVQPVPFDLILMDIEMPVQDGLTCARKIRELEASGTVFSAGGGRVPIIAVSAHARNEHVVAALGAGCDDVLVKPYRMAELMERIEDIASGARAEEARQ